MKMFATGAALIVAAQLTAANAATLTYEYVGNPLELDLEALKKSASSEEEYISLLQGVLRDFDGWLLEDKVFAIPGFTGKVVLSEEQFGGSFANKTVALGCDPSDWPATPSPPATRLGFFLDDACRSAAGVYQFDLTFDDMLKIVAWDILILDGPPDYWSYSTTGDGFYEPSWNTVWRAEPGTWTLTNVEGDLAVIPVPAGAALLLTGIGGLVGFRFRRRAPRPQRP